MRTSSIFTGLFGLLLTFNLAAQSPCDGADHTVLAGSFYFSPQDLTINEGESVAFINEGGFHDVNGNVSVLSGESFDNPEAFSLGAVNASGMDVCIGTHIFTVAGTYNYDCSIGSHATNGMVGSITVEAAATGCNDDLACNFDSTATSDVDCQYNDGTFDFSSGFWLVPITALDPGLGCDIQPAVGTITTVISEEGQPVTVVVDADLEAYINGAVDDGLLTSLQAILLLSALEQATFSFCGNTMTGIAGLNTIESEWNGQSWSLGDLGLNLAPVSTLEDGCGDPDALNYDPCVNPDTSLCEYLAVACDDPLACNYDSTSVGNTDCNYFDTNLFTLGENDFIGLVDDEDCESGYPGAYSLPVPLTQDSTGGPLFFVLFPDVEGFLVENGFEIAAQDIATVSVSVCDTVMNYNSLVIGDTDLNWDGMGFTVDLYGSFVAPESSFPIGCPDPDACNFDACSHPFVSDACTYIELGDLATAAGDTGLVTMSELDSLTFVATPGEGLTLEWDSECGELIVDGNTATLVGPETGDCEVCVEAENADGCEIESCIVVTVLGGIDDPSNAQWQLMPNPAASELRVVWGGETTPFEVFDLNGRRVHTATLQPGSQVMDVSALLPGLYLAGPRGYAPQRLAIQR